MIRNTAKLADTQFDLLVVGAGIHGAFVAWDATLRGLRVAIVDAQDFGGEASANSLKVIHGGLRYLQQMSLRRIRESIAERAMWLALAPRFVRPMPFMIPTRGYGKEGSSALSIALWLNDQLNRGANRGLRPDRRIAPGRVVGRHEAVRLAPSLDDLPIDGGAVWHDGHALNTERLTLAVILSACAGGATAANYIECEEIRAADGRVQAANVRDLLTGERIGIRARAVVNATGGPLRVAERPDAEGCLAPARALAINLVMRPISQSVAFGVRSPRSREADPIGGGRRFLFLVPWRTSCLVGTFYRPWNGTEMPRVTDALVASILEECREACPSLDLGPDDVRRAHAGLLPLGVPRPAAAPGSRGSDGAGAAIGPLMQHARIVDHSAHGGPRGMVSVFGVKYTTARRVAEEAVDVVFRTLGVDAPPACLTASVSLGLEESSSPTTDGAPEPGPTERALARLRAIHGDAAPEVLSRARVRDPNAEAPLAPNCPVLRAEVVHAVSSEMAVHLSDVVFRRTDLGSEMAPGAGALRGAADLMGDLLGWAGPRRDEEIAAVQGSFRS